VGLRYPISLEIMVDKFILRPKKLKKNHPIFKVAMELYGEEIMSIRNKVCPFCGRQFKCIRIHLKNHSTKLVKVEADEDYLPRKWWHDVVWTNGCALRYRMMLKDVVEEYLRRRSPQAACLSAAGMASRTAAYARRGASHEPRPPGLGGSGEGG